MSKERLWFFLVVATFTLHAGCRSAPSAEKAPAPSAAPPPVTPVATPSAPPRRIWQVPVGPQMAILAGRGVGPIRFGATVPTIERLMEAPCEYKDADSCRYVGRGIEFTLKGGVAAQMHVHRGGRPATPKPRIFGPFNGATPEGLAFKMLPTAVQELLGTPLKTETVQNGGDWNTVEIRHYKGLDVELDRLENGSIGVGGMVIFPDPTLQKR